MHKMISMNRIDDVICVPTVKLAKVNIDLNSLDEKKFI